MPIAKFVAEHYAVAANGTSLYRKTIEKLTLKRILIIIFPTCIPVIYIIIYE